MQYISNTYYNFTQLLVCLFIYIYMCVCVCIYIYINVFVSAQGYINEADALESFFGSSFQLAFSLTLS